MEGSDQILNGPFESVQIPKTVPIYLSSLTVRDWPNKTVNEKGLSANYSRFN